VPSNEKKPPWWIWKEDELQPNAENAGKASHEDKQWEKGIGNRKPEKPPEGETKAEVSLGPLFKLSTEFEGAAVDSSAAKDADKKTFYKLAQGKVGDVEILSANANLTEAKAKVVIAKMKAEGSVAHGEIDIVDQITKLFFGDDPYEPPAFPAVVPAPMAARVGDLVAHGGLLLPGIGSPNVMIGGMPAWRAGLDTHLCTAPGTPHGIGVAMPGAASVLINGFPAARASDCLVEAAGGADLILLGCPTVLIGESAPPPAAGAAADKPPEEPSMVLDVVAKGDFLAAEADVQAYAEADLSKGKVVAEAQAGAMAALFKGELPLKVKIPIPGTEFTLGVGVTLEGTLLSAGAEGGMGVVLNDKGKVFDVTGGAKVGAGIGGVGAKFGFEMSKN
jgi:uncharacterized Zn-binding protein involved in type VI secretion